MHYAIAIWNYYEPPTRLPALIEEFAGMGYDAMSFTSAQLKVLDPGEVQDAARALEALGLVATMHGNFAVSVEDLLGYLDLFAGRVIRCTWDAQMHSDTRGSFYDTGAMAPYIGGVLCGSEGSGLMVGVEDFPLDMGALDYYRSDLEPLIASGRYGMLIDVGHMNMRLHGGGYFEGQSVGDYFRALPLEIVEVHLHDNDGTRDQHGHFGFGNTPFEQVAGALREVGFAGVSTIEIAPTFHGSSPRESKPRAQESLTRWRELWEG